jgi:hypothetical protein
VAGRYSNTVPRAAVSFLEALKLSVRKFLHSNGSLVSWTYFRTLHRFYAQYTRTLQGFELVPFHSHSRLHIGACQIFLTVSGIVLNMP